MFACDIADVDMDGKIGNEPRGISSVAREPVHGCSTANCTAFSSVDDRNSSDRKEQHPTTCGWEGISCVPRSPPILKRKD